MKVIIIMLFVICCLSCEFKLSDLGGESVSKTNLYKHDNGLVVEAAETLGRFVETERGFNVMPQQDNDRQINALRIEVHDKIPFTAVQNKKVDGFEYAYLVEVYDGGSGGANTQ